MTIAEALGAQSQLNASLDAGVNTLSLNQTVTFAEYVRKVLPLDGFIFWLKTSNSFTAQGSLHVAIDLNQNEDETFARNRVIFTAEQQVQDFDAVAPDTMYIATIGNERFAFSRQANFYQQAGLYHYSGDAVNPAVGTQIVDDPATLDLTNLIVSNSLPLWLSLGSASVFGKTAPTFPIYPSFLIPQNAAPPYASVQIGGGDTRAIQSAPRFDIQDSHFQLCKDNVRIVFYGLRNDAALDFQDFVFQYSLDTDNIGIMNMPVIRDEKRTQSEIAVLAQKKSMDLEISYYQSRIETVTRQLILQSIQTYIVNPL